MELTALNVDLIFMSPKMHNPKPLEIRLSKAYKSTLENEKKLRTYLYERYFSNNKRPGERPSSIR
jgi:hypothetical protein